MSDRPIALLDSNVLIAAVCDVHPHHHASAALFDLEPLPQFGVAAHAFAETYANLTKRGERAAFQWSPEVAWRAIERLSSMTTLLGLSPAQTFDAIRDYAAKDGVGARLYDRLIGEVAQRNGIKRIITWNVGHLQSLFPDLDVTDPTSIPD